MPVDVESQLARLGAAWNTSIVHVEFDELRERHARADSLDLTVADIGGGANERSSLGSGGRPWWLFAAAAALAGALVWAVAVRLTHRDGPLPGHQPTTSVDVPTTTTALRTTTTSAPQLAFAAVGNMAGQGCFQCPAVLLDDGRVFVGGFSTQVFDVATETFSPIASQGDGFDRAAKLADGRVVLAGMNGDVGVFDPTTDGIQLLRTENDPAQLVQPGSYTVQLPVPLPDGRVLLFDQMGVSQLNLTTGQLSRVGTMDIVLADTMIAVLLHDGTVLIAGASGDVQVTATYDPTTGTFSPTGSPVWPMTNASAIVLHDGRVLVSSGGLHLQHYDPVARMFGDSGSPPESGGTWAQLSALLPDGRVLIVTASGDIETSASTSFYDPITETFRAGPDTLRPRFGATGVALADGRVLLMGSYRGNAEGIPGDGPISAEILSFG